MKRKLIALLLCLLCCWTLPGLAQPAGQMAVRAFKAGKADAFLIRAEGRAILIDTAEEDDAGKILKYLNRMQVSKLDLLILTHFDKGHIGGAPAILKAIPVDRVLMPDYLRGGQWYEALEQALTATGIQPERLTEPLLITLGPLTLEVLAGGDYREDDNYSLVTRLSHGGQRLLFCADIGDERITELLKQPDRLQADLIQVPWHGKMQAQSEALLKAVGARQALITCSEKNPPDVQILALLKDMGIPYLLTMDGSIDIISDGQRLWLDQ